MERNTQTGEIMNVIIHDGCELPIELCECKDAPVKVSDDFIKEKKALLRMWKKLMRTETVQIKEK